jgi:hypothetical protein
MYVKKKKLKKKTKQNMVHRHPNFKAQIPFWPVVPFLCGRLDQLTKLTGKKALQILFLHFSTALGAAIRSRSRRIFHVSLTVPII